MFNIKINKLMHMRSPLQEFSLGNSDSLPPPALVCVPTMPGLPPLQLW